MDHSLAGLLSEIEAEARRDEFPIDRETYSQHAKDPLVPILTAGALTAPVCSFGRELGRDEVRWGQPQVGAAGRQVRAGVLRALDLQVEPGDRRLDAALASVLLTNTVPYKPPGNKAYSDAVKRRFRPFLERLLVFCWSGSVVVTLGNEAFDWFAQYAEPGAADQLWRRDDRYEAELHCRIPASWGDLEQQKSLTVCPLPHPSPLNQRWLNQFPTLLDHRLRGRIAA
jgi:uracil-DNA glycosylase